MMKFHLHIPAMMTQKEKILNQCTTRLHQWVVPQTTRPTPGFLLEPYPLTNGMSVFSSVICSSAIKCDLLFYGIVIFQNFAVKAYIQHAFKSIKSYLKKSFLHLQHGNQEV